MIEKFYATHIKNMIDTTKTNVRSKNGPNGTVPKRAANAKRARAAKAGGYPRPRR
jgi:hypothetical protein